MKPRNKPGVHVNRVEKAVERASNRVVRQSVLPLLKDPVWLTS